MEILLSFTSTNDAIAAEAALLKAGLAVRVMNLPSAIRTGCGICLRVTPQQLHAACRALDGEGIRHDGLYSRTTQAHGSVYKPYTGGGDTDG